MKLSNGWAAVLLSLLAIDTLGACKSETQSSAPANAVSTVAVGTSPDPGAGASTSAAAPSKPPPEAQVPRLLELTSELAAVHTSARDCAELTQKLRTWDSEHGAELREIPALTYGAVERAPTAKARLHENMEAVMNAGMVCSEHPEFANLQRDLKARQRESAERTVVEGPAARPSQ